MFNISIQRQLLLVITLGNIIIVSTFYGLWHVHCCQMFLVHHRRPGRRYLHEATFLAGRDVFGWPWRTVDKSIGVVSVVVRSLRGPRGQHTTPVVGRMWRSVYVISRPCFSKPLSWKHINYTPPSCCVTSALFPPW